MGILKSIVDGIRSFTSSEVRIVNVTFCELHETRATLGSRGYAYLWTLNSSPNVGARVFVPGSDGPAPAMVVAVDALVPNGYKRSELKSVLRFPTKTELARAEAKIQRAEDDEVKWLNMARKAAGLPTMGRVMTKPPAGFDPIPPVDGGASAAEAAEHGRIWYRLYKRAEDRGWHRTDVQRFKSIAHRWYAIRDRG